MGSGSGARKVLSKALTSGRAVPVGHDSQVRPRQGTREQQPTKGTRERGKQENGNSEDCLLWKTLKVQNDKLLLAVSFVHM